MAFAVTAYRVYGKEIDEAVTKTFEQTYQIDFTAAVGDVALDIGNTAGTFWTAAGGSAAGAVALAALKTIIPVTQSRICWSLPQLQDLRSQEATAATLAATQYKLTTVTPVPSIAEFAGEGITSGTFSVTLLLKPEVLPVSVNS